MALTLALGCDTAAAAPVAPPVSPPAVAALGSGIAAVRAGRFAAAVPELQRALAGGVLNREHAQFFLGEALRGLDRPAEAVPHFEAVARESRGRFAVLAGFRVAESLWQAGQRDQATSRYRPLVKRTAAKARRGPAVRRDQTVGADQRALLDARVLAYVRLVEGAQAHGRRAEVAAWCRILIEEFPAHPGARVSQCPAPAPAAGPVAAAAGAGLPPAVVLRRAALLSEGRRWPQALDELQRLPAGLPEPLAAQRDFLIGKTLFESRRDYPRAAALLLAVAPRLRGRSKADAAWAAFHGARALSRADRDDEAIAGYQRFVADYPRAPLAAEGSYLAGFLDFNQGKFRAALPALHATMERFPRSPFSADAAWVAALAHFLLGDAAAALSALDAFEARAGLRDEFQARDRAVYFRARFLAALAQVGPADELWAGLAAKAPFSWYGMLASARLRERGRSDPGAPWAVGAPTAGVGAAPTPGWPVDAPAHPLIARADELLAAGLNADAAWAWERDAGLLIAELPRRVRWPRAAAAAFVIARAGAAGAFHRAYELAESHGKFQLAEPPSDAARLYWQAAYPLAFGGLVDKYGPKAGNPPHFLHAIMRKESGFDPDVVSYADARGLLQMIPPTSRRVAAELGVPYDDDRLFDPEINLELGAAYIGGLLRKFRGETVLAAGAFNAGPRAMQKFCARFGTHPTDIFVELITYPQTREYVKRVSGNFARYRALYAGQRVVPPARLDCQPVEGGPTY